MSSPIQSFTPESDVDEKNAASIASAKERVAYKLNGRLYANARYMRSISTSQ